jgi:uncharacterized protein
MSVLPMPRRNPQIGFVWIIVAAFVLLVGIGSASGVILDYFWWQEMGQVATFWRMLEYRFLPNIVAWVIVFLVLWISHARGIKHAGTSLHEHPAYARITTALAAFLSLMIALATVNGWTVARYVGGASRTAAQNASAWADPVFGRRLEFYFFELPFFEMLLTFLAVCAFGGALVYYVAARLWQLKKDIPGFTLGQDLDLRDLKLLGSLESIVFKGLVALFLIAMAAKFWLGRYDLLLSDHGNLMVGVDYVQQNLGLPLQTAKAGFAILAAFLVLVGRRKLAIACAVILVVDIILPPIVSGIHVRPNELTLEKPYLERHIQATRSAYGLDRRAKEVEFPAHSEARINFADNKTLLDNVRLWDWRAFHDTLSQSQPLRPYTYSDTDVDRYVIDGKLRQTLLAPRELDLNQLGDARNRWINRALTFTHGYGLVLAEANQITEAGLPELIVRDAPVQVRTKSLQVKRPEIYYGEASGEPVFVRTSQPEFNYPAGSREVNTSYSGRGGFSVASMGVRTLAALAEGDWNIVLSSALGANSRMMIRRNVVERVSALAPFMKWDEDPYLVITQDGRLVWIIDGYLTSDAHPYSRSVTTEGLGSFNYIRNSVKATVDAYDGDVHLYEFDSEDPLVRAYQTLFPELFSPVSSMPPGLRSHVRVPETLFRIQAEVYRTYHMKDPESYYNRADLWDLATYTTGSAGQPMAVPPTYIVAELPGAKDPEFLLMIQFTPRNKQNLIGLMVARCDDEHLGELVYLQLPKDEVIQGPLQVEALINQDQNISKDLTLWNQQGSQVLRAQILTLPIDQTLLYVAPIYIQAAQARMPQLKKVALVQGGHLIYADTYQQALAQLEAAQSGRPVTISSTSSPPGGAGGTAVSETTSRTSTGPDPRIETIRMHLQRYRELSSQGKWAEAGKELEAVESAVKK